MNIADQVQDQVDDVVDDQVDDDQIDDQADGSDSDADGDSDQDQDADSSSAGDSKGGSRLQKRFDKLTREKYEYKAKADLLEKMMAQGSTPQEQLNAGGPPQREQFDDDDDYEQAVIDYRIEQKVNAAVEKKVASKDADNLTASWESKRKEAQKDLPDYDEVLEDSTSLVSDAMQQAIVSSDIGPRIAYYLAKNPEDTDRIYRMKPVQAAMEIGKIEAKLVSNGTGQRRVSNAPAPARPIGGGGGSRKDPEKMTMAEYAAWRASKSKR